MVPRLTTNCGPLAHPSSLLAESTARPPIQLTNRRLYSFTRKQTPLLCIDPTRPDDVHAQRNCRSRVYKQPSSLPQSPLIIHLQHAHHNRSLPNTTNNTTHTHLRSNNDNEAYPHLRLRSRRSRHGCSCRASARCHGRLGTGCSSNQPAFRLPLLR